MTLLMSIPSDATSSELIGKNDEEQQALIKNQAADLLVPVPAIRISSSDATYLVLRNGYKECSGMFWWAFLDAYTRDFLQETARWEKLADAFSAPPPDAESKQWKEPIDGEWKRILQRQFYNSVRTRLGDAPEDGQLAAMREIHLGCFLAVSHYKSDLEPLASVIRGMSGAAFEPALDKCLPSQSEVHRAGDCYREFEAASMAFNQMQQRICDYKARNSRKAFPVPQTDHEKKLILGKIEKMKEEEAIEGSL